jgi:hypothetical protein
MTLIKWTHVRPARAVSKSKNRDDQLLPLRSSRHEGKKSKLNGSFKLDGLQIINETFTDVFLLFAAARC